MILIRVPLVRNPAGRNPGIKNNASNQDIAGLKANPDTSRGRNVITPHRLAIINPGRHRTMDRGRGRIIPRLREGTIKRRRVIISQRHSNRVTKCRGHISRRRKAIIPANG